MGQPRTVGEAGSVPGDEPRQFVLDLPHRPAFGAEDYLVSAANSAAVALIDRWPDWPLASSLVVGPPGSGKTHLAHVWRLKAGAGVLAAASISEAAVATLRTAGALVIEDIDRGIADEPMLFHLLNLAREQGYSLLLTSARPPGELQTSLPDLRSRLRALPMVAIEAPDETLLKAVLVKLFTDRQLVVEPHVVEHVALHMERSMAAARGIVAEIDRRALALRRKVTRSLAAEALAALRGGAGP
ncbi:MAG: DnaA ATPase domain-containing protein [Hyphomicrobiaceae bacterium]